MKIAVIALPAAALALAGCVTTGQPVAVPALVQDITQIATQAQADAKVICGFTPALADVISLINAGVGTGVSAIAGAICDSPFVLSAARGHRGVAARIVHLPNGKSVVVRAAR